MNDLIPAPDSCLSSEYNDALDRTWIIQSEMVYGGIRLSIVGGDPNLVLIINRFTGHYEALHLETAYQHILKQSPEYEALKGQAEKIAAHIEENNRETHS